MPGIIPIPGDILESRVVLYGTSQIAENIYHWVVTATTAGGVTLADIANAMDNTYVTNYKNICPTVIKYRGTSFTNLSPPRTREFAYVANDGNCNVAQNVAPYQCAPVITWNTLNAGRQFRGRTYLPFLFTTAVLSDSTVSGAYNATMVTLAANVGGSHVIAGGGGTCSFIQVVFHPKSFTVTPVTDFVARFRIGTQRRRGSYGRQNALPF